MIEVSKKLLKANVKFSRIERYAFNTWELTFPTKNLANTALSNNILKDLGIKSFIPKYKLCRKIMLRDIPFEISLEELKEAIEEENTHIIAVNMFRLKRRDRESKQRTDSLSVGIEIRNEVLPENLIII